MSEPMSSVPDVAELLMHEFRSVCSGSVVTEVVLRLARLGEVSFAELAEAARRELGSLGTMVTS